jgi:hypothetical protein
VRLIGVPRSFLFATAVWLIVAANAAAQNAAFVVGDPRLDGSPAFAGERIVWVSDGAVQVADASGRIETIDRLPAPGQGVQDYAYPVRLVATASRLALWRGQGRCQDDACKYEGPTPVLSEIREGAVLGPLAARRSCVEEDTGPLLTDGASGERCERGIEVRSNDGTIVRRYGTDLDGSSAADLEGTRVAYGERTDRGRNAVVVADWRSGEELYRLDTGGRIADQLDLDGDGNVAGVLIDRSRTRAGTGFLARAAAPALANLGQAQRVRFEGDVVAVLYGERVEVRDGFGRVVGAVPASDDFDLRGGRVLTATRPCGPTLISAWDLRLPPPSRVRCAGPRLVAPATLRVSQGRVTVQVRCPEAATGGCHRATVDVGIAGRECGVRDCVDESRELVLPPGARAAVPVTVPKEILRRLRERPVRARVRLAGWSGVFADRVVTLRRSRG